MDFSLSDEQQAITDLAARILTEQCPVETLRALERSDDNVARDAWAALAGADLLGLALPAESGGSGLGILDAGLVAQQVGRRAAPVPYWTSTAAALAIARWGRDGQRRRWLQGAADGTAPLAVALWQPAELGSAERPAVLATPRDDGWILDGTKSPVPWARQAAALVVPVRLGDAGVGVLLVDRSAPGLRLVDEQVVTGEPLQTVVFDEVPVGEDDLLGSAADGEEVARWLAQHTTALLVATALGVCEEALALTARHVTERQQFDVPIGTFQAVAHRCADAYVDTEAIRLTAAQAIWRLDAGLDAAQALAVAAFWVAEGGQRVVHAAQHLHGGIGMDLDYPIHRYFRWAKLLESLVGGAHGALAQLGAVVAADTSLET
jgi:alkylation response protein AidB-like acyl-CoA dehydrogenase